MTTKVNWSNSKSHALCHFYEMTQYSYFCYLTKLGGRMGLVAKRAMDENVCKKGRKYGGCAILWKHDITGKVSLISMQ